VRVLRLSTQADGWTLGRDAHTYARVMPVLHSRQVAAWRLLCEGEVSSGGAQVRTVPYFIFYFSHSHAPTSLLSQRVSLIGPLDWCAADRAHAGSAGTSQAAL
jgi:hypothetical protein